MHLASYLMFHEINLLSVTKGKNALLPVSLGSIIATHHNLYHISCDA